MRIAFLGTPEFAVPALSALHAAGHKIALVVAQPDRPSGRGNRLQPPPVILRAQELGLPTMQPSKVRSGAFPEAMKALGLDLAVVVAYGRILTAEVLAAPRDGCVNVHASLLPRWRGAAPIQWAIHAGDAQTGVCVQQMVEALDAGDLLAEARTPILPADDTPALLARLSAMGADLITDTLARWPERRAAAQDPAGVTLARIIRKEDGLVDWTQPAQRIDCQIRAFSGWPGATTLFRGEVLKILRAAPAPHLSVLLNDGPGMLRPGMLLSGGIVACGIGGLQLLEVQLPGRKATGLRDFLNGSRVQPGELLG